MHLEVGHDVGHGDDVDHEVVQVTEDVGHDVGHGDGDGVGHDDCDDYDDSKTPPGCLT